MNIKALFTLLSLIVLFALGGCQLAPSDGSATAEQVANETADVPRATFYRPYEIHHAKVTATRLAPVQSVACDEHGGAPRAQLALLRQADEIGANGVVLERCAEVHSAECVLAFECRGHAYEIDDRREGQGDESQGSPIEQPSIWF